MSYDIHDRYPLDPETCVHDKALSREGRCGMCGLSLDDLRLTALRKALASPNNGFVSPEEASR